MNSRNFKDFKGKCSKLLEESDRKPYSKPWKDSDLVLSVEDRKFHVHRALLKVASEVFETMFTSNFKEKSAPQIELPGKKASDIEQLLNFIYPDKDFILSKNNYFSIFKLANEYQIERLMGECQKFLSDWCERGMSGEEAIEVIVFSQMYPLEEESVTQCIKMVATRVDKTWPEIEQHRLFAQLKPETVRRLMLERIDYFEDRLNVGSEYVTVRYLDKIARPAKRPKVL